MNAAADLHVCVCVRAELSTQLSKELFNEEAPERHNSAAAAAAPMSLEHSNIFAAGSEGRSRDLGRGS